MVVKLRTSEGVPVHVPLPSGFVPGVAAALSLLVGFFAWMSGAIVSNQRLLTSHEERIVQIEETRFTAEDARSLDAQFVSLREHDALAQRLTRIEDKLDRLLEGR